MKQGWTKRLSFFLAILLIVQMAIAPLPFVHAAGQPFHVTVDDAERKDASETASFAGGAIDEQTAPKLPGKRFVRAYVVDEKSGQQVPIVAAEEQNGKVYFTMEHEANNGVKLAYPSNESTKIHFEYLNAARTFTLSYEVPADTMLGMGAQIVIEGPQYIENIGGTGTAIVTVSCIRSHKPTLSADGGTVSMVNDLSTAERTVQQFEVKVQKDTVIKASSTEIENVKVTFANNPSDDWKAGPDPLLGSRPLENYSNSNKRVELPSYANSFSRGSNISFKVYWDKTIYTNFSHGVMLADIQLNGQFFGAPQPLGRYGPSMYAKSEPGNPLKRPYYTSLQSDSSGKQPEQSARLNPNLVLSYVQCQKWDPYWDAYRNNTYFRNWYVTQIAEKVIGQKTERVVTHGPLAGSTVVITIADAKPGCWERPLMDWYTDYDGNITVGGQPLDIMKKDIGGFPDSSGEWGGYGYGYWNSLRIAYDVTIKNVKTDIEINDEWVRTSNTKTGVYLNRGVENLQVYNAYTEYQGGARENPPAINGWKDIPDGGTWLDAPSFAGYSPQRRNNAVIEHNADPQLLIRGDVKNGYGSVTYLDDSRTATHGGDPFVVENSSHASAAGHGFYGAFPLFAVGYDEADNSGTRFNLYGGMNIVGLQADLLDFPYTFDLQGGTVSASSEFPTTESKLAKFHLNAESHTVMNVPVEVPKKGSEPFLFWKLVRVTEDGDEDTGLKLLPGQRVVATNPSEVGGRLSDTEGTRLVNAFKLVAVYGSSMNGAPGVYNVQVQLKNGDTVEETKSVSSFFGVAGAIAELNPETIAQFAPETLTGANGKRYKRVITDEQIQKGMAIKLEDTNNLFDLEYRLVVDENTLYDPAGGTISVPKDTPLSATQGQDKAREAITNHAALPATATYAFKDTVDTHTPGEKQAQVVITYSDGTKDEVTVTVLVGSEAERWAEANGEAGNLKGVEATYDYDQSVGEVEHKALIENADQLPANAQIEVTGINTHPTSAPAAATHEQTATVKVTFSDQSVLEKTVPVHVRTAADTFTPEMTSATFNANVGDAITDEQAKALVNTAALPTGTRVVWKDPVSTATSSEGEKELRVIYPDTTEDPAFVTLKVKSQADHWKEENNKSGITGKPQTFDYGYTLTIDDLWNFVQEKDLFDPAKQVVSVTPEVNTKVQKDAPDQEITVSVTFQDGSALSAKTTAHIRTAAETFDPTAKDITVGYGQNPTQTEINNAVTAGKGKTFPENTQIELTSAFDNTKVGEAQEVTYTVTYPDGTKDTVTGHITVTETRDDATKYEPQTANISVDYGATEIPSTSEGITNKYDASAADPSKNLPQGTTFSPDKGTFKTTEVGAHPVEVTVTYPDQTSEKVTVTYVVKSAKDTFNPQPADPITVALHSKPGAAEAEEAIHTSGLPEGTQYRWADPGVDTSTTGKKDAVVIVQYPDGTEDTVPVKVNVTSEADQWVREHGALTDTIATYTYGSSLTSADYRQLIKDGDDLPGTVTFTIDREINTTPTSKAGRLQPTKVTVTFADGSQLTTERDSYARIDEAAKVFDPQAKVPGVTVLTGTALTAEHAQQAVDTTGLPTGTTYAFQDAVDTAQPGIKPAVVVVTYPDESKDTVSVNITVRNDAYDWNTDLQLVTQPQTFAYGSTITQDQLKSLVANYEQLPEGAVVSVQPAINTTPESPDDYRQTVQVTVTFADQSTLSAPVVVTISEKQSDGIEATAKKPNLEVEKNEVVGDDRAPETVVVKGAPENSTITFKTPVDTSNPGTVDAIVVITCPDGSTKEVPVQIEVRDQAYHWSPDGNLPTQDQTFDWGAVLTDDNYRQFVQNSANLPQGSRVDVTEVNTKPENEKDHVQTVHVKVTFPDNSVLEGDAQATIRNLSDTISVTPKQPNLTVNLNEPVDDRAGETVVIPNKPEGTTIRFKNPVDTSTPGDKNATVVVHFPDGTEKEVPVVITVNDEAGKWNSDRTLITQPQTFNWGAAIGDEELRSLIKDGDKLPPNATVSVDPAINTKPDNEKGRTQEIQVTVRFADGSSLTGPVTVTIRPLAEGIDVKPKQPGLVVNKGDVVGDDRAQETVDMPNAPENTTVRFETPVDTSTTGNKEVNVIVHFPDGSAKTVPVVITVTDKGSEWEKIHGALEGQEATYPYASTIGDAELRQLIKQGADLPEDVILQAVPEINTRPESEAGRTQPVNVTVEFPDGSLRSVEATAKIGPASDYFHPIASDPGVTVKTGETLTNEHAKGAIDITDLPEGTEYTFPNPVDTTTPGDKETTVEITYPDGSKTTVPVVIHVTNDAYEWEKEHGSLTVQEADFKWGEEITQAALRRFIPEDSALPEDILVKTQPEINTLPTTEEGHTQPVMVIVQFPDGSTLQAPSVAHISFLKDDIEVSPKEPNLTVDQGSTVGDDEARSTIVGELPDGTKVSFKTPVNTDTPGDKEAIVIVSFPDGSTLEIPVLITVNEKKVPVTPQPSKPTKPSQPEKPVMQTTVVVHKAPQTGDQGVMILMIVLVVAAGISVVLWIKRKSKR